MNWRVIILSKVFQEFATKTLSAGFWLWLKKYVELIQASGLLGISILSM